MGLRVSNLSAAGHREINWRGGWLWALGRDPSPESVEGAYSPKWVMHPGEAQVLLVPHLGSLESLPFVPLSKHLKQNETTPHALGSLPPGRRVNDCWCSVRPAPTGPEFCLDLGPCTLRSSGSASQRSPAFNVSSLLATPYPCLWPLSRPKRGDKDREKFAFAQMTALRSP